MGLERDEMPSSLSSHLFLFQIPAAANVSSFPRSQALATGRLLTRERTSPVVERALEAQRRSLERHD